MRCFFTACLAILFYGGDNFVAHAYPAAPNTLVVVACRVDDLTGQPGRQNVEAAARSGPELALSWRDLELHLDKRSLEYQCKREALPLVDAVAQYWPPKVAVPLHPNFGNPVQCGHIGVGIVADWETEHKGWGVVAIGCPVPIVQDANADGVPDVDENGQYIILDWKLPGCPSYLPGKYDPAHPENNRMKCNFDASLI